MNESAPDHPSHIAKQRLRDTCRARDKSVRLAWAITIGEALLLAVAAIALMDYWLMLPLRYRWAGTVGLAVLALFGIWRLIRFYRHPSRMKDAALDVEGQRPELGCEISTAAEYLSGERQPKQEFEPELVAALEARAAERLGKAKSPYQRKLRNPLILMTATLLVLLAAALAVPGLFTALTRAALPFLKVQYTTLEVKPGNIEIPVGRDVTITNLFTGREPKGAQLHWQQAPNPAWQTVGLARGSNEHYLHLFKNVRAGLKYRVTGGDAVSDEYEITTFFPPEVKDLGIRIDYPEYTRRKATAQRAPEISVIRASTASFRIEPTMPLAKARLKFSNQPEVPLQAAADGSWTGSFKILKDTEYWIELADEKGHLGVNEKAYQIKAAPDAPPKVEIAEPGQDIRAASTNAVPVKISVTDDFGVGEIKVVFHKLGGSEQTVLAIPIKDQSGEVSATAELDLSPLNLREYELVAYHAEAKDYNNVDGPGIGKSPVYFVEITNEEGGACKSQCKGEKVNLLVIQKQIIADTAALAASAAPDKFKELAARQHDATDFGRIYLDALSGAAPPAAVTEMQAAVREMESANGHLNGRRRADALPPEESALAHLYQVLKLMPELENLPTKSGIAKKQPPPNDKIKVVLEAIKNKKKAEQDNKAIEQLLQEVQNLTRQQAGVNSQCQNPGQSSSAAESRSANQNENKKANRNNNPSKSESKLANQNKNQSKGKSKSQGQGQGQGAGEGQAEAPQNGEQPNEQVADSKEVKSPEELANKQDQLGKEAAALAEMLQRLAGKDTRVGHNAGKNATTAAQKMGAAAQAIKQGNFGMAGINGFQGELSLQRVIAQLERILKDQPDGSDIANEEFPKEYEAVISEYLK
ncbi:MAG: hypothetical protein DME26_16040, partial [Verrucomicrobia bacterium]